jgi:hypothetical protein
LILTIHGLPAFGLAVSGLALGLDAGLGCLAGPEMPKLNRKSLNPWRNESRMDIVRVLSGFFVLVE